MDAQEAARWMIRIAVACYVLRVTERVMFRHRVPSLFGVAVWSCGCAFYLFHLVLAFYAFHDWSHQAAVRFTAEETQRVVGIRRGEGVWVNYLFAFVWFGDCVRLEWHRRHRTVTSNPLDIVIASFFALIMVSATVIFGPPVYRYLTPFLLVLWGYLWTKNPATNGRLDSQ